MPLVGGSVGGGVGLKSRKTKRDARGVVPLSLVKMARVEVKLFRFIYVWGRGGAARRARVLGKDGV